jgi:hypothetical protein
MQNGQIIKELMQVLADMDYFAIHPSSQLRTLLRDASTDGDRIRTILRDQDVQEYIFPDWKTFKDSPYNPVDHYVRLRKNGTIPPR